MKKIETVVVGYCNDIIKRAQREHSSRRITRDQFDALDALTQAYNSLVHAILKEDSNGNRTNE